MAFATVVISFLFLVVGRQASVSAQESYSQNAICRQNYCINPVFPGVNDMQRLEQLTWQCSTFSLAKPYIDFCAGAISYDPALPSPVSAAINVETLVHAQDQAASTMFFYHLNGMGFEPWDFTSPAESDNECVKSVWKMVCFTYFPKAQAGCLAGQASAYMRPCLNSCQNYLKACNVECCDESVECVFSHSDASQGFAAVVQNGYSDQTSPSAMCTGSANSGARRSFRMSVLVLIAMVLSLTVHGFSILPDNLSVPTHKISNWQAKKSYLADFSYVKPGDTPTKKALNSCREKQSAPTRLCSGHGYCKAFITANALDDDPLDFCVCNRYWADPECRTQRKSQIAAYFLSLFVGWLGADYFYLGFWGWAVAKLLALGGLGYFWLMDFRICTRLNFWIVCFWWLIDIVRTGSGPVYAYNFRVADDLPHSAYVILTVFVFLLMGFLLTMMSYFKHRGRKRARAMKLQQEEEGRRYDDPEEIGVAGLRPRHKQQTHDYEGRRGWAGYGAMLPIPHPNAGEPYAAPLPGEENFGPAGPFGPAGIQGVFNPMQDSIGAAPTNLLSFGDMAGPGRQG